MNHLQQPFKSSQFNSVTRMMNQRQTFIQIHNCHWRKTTLTMQLIMVKPNTQNRMGLIRISVLTQKFSSTLPILWISSTATPHQRNSAFLSKNLDINHSFIGNLEERYKWNNQLIYIILMEKR